MQSNHCLNPLVPFVLTSVALSLRKPTRVDSRILRVLRKVHGSRMRATRCAYDGHARGVGQGFETARQQGKRVML